MLDSWENLTLPSRFSYSEEWLFEGYVCSITSATLPSSGLDIQTEQ